jgi:hypothetical protein
MSVQYSIQIDEELARRLQQDVDDDTIVEVLENTAEKYGSRSDDELAQYDSVKQIRSDQSISAEERKRRELTWQRKVGRPVR